MLHSAKQRFDKSISSKSSLWKDKQKNAKSYFSVKVESWIFSGAVESNFSIPFLSAPEHRFEKFFFMRWALNVNKVHWNLFIWCYFSRLSLQSCLQKFQRKKEHQKSYVERSFLHSWRLHFLTSLLKERVERISRSLQRRVNSHITW